MRFLLRAYCLPGQIFAYWKYINPRRGETFATARWKNDRFVHALFSTACYFAIGMGIHDQLNSHNVSVVPRTTQSSSLPEPMVEYAPSSTKLDGSRSSSSNADPGEAPVGPTEVNIPQASANSETLQSEQLTSDQDDFISHIQHDETVKAAAETASMSGNVERWASHGLEGQVTPKKNSAQCIELRVEVDHLEHSLQPYDPIIKCGF